MVGAPEPMDAIQDAVNLHGFDEIILSTLPKRVSRWLQARPAVQAQRPRAAGHDRHRERARDASPKGPSGVDRRNPSLSGAVTPFLYWMQVLIVVCVLASIVIAIVKL